MQDNTGRTQPGQLCRCSRYQEIKAIKDGRAGSDDSCFQEFVNIVYCYLFEMVWKLVLVN